MIDAGAHAYLKMLGVDVESVITDWEPHNSS